MILQLPIIELAKHLNISVRKLEMELSYLKKTNLEVYNAYSVKGFYEGYKKQVLLFSSDINKFFVEKKLKQGRPEKKKEKTVKKETATLTPNVNGEFHPRSKNKKGPIEKKIVIDRVAAKEESEPDIIEIPDSPFYGDFNIEWNEVYQLLEAGCTLEEISGRYRIPKQVIQKLCKRDLKISFDELRLYKLHSGNVNIRLKMYAMAVGTKNLPSNPGILLTVARDRLRTVLPTGNIGAGTGNPENIISIGDKTYNLDTMTSSEIEELENQLKNEINNENK